MTEFNTIVLFSVITLLSVFYSYKTNQDENTEYIYKVHHATANIMKFHALVTSIVIYLRPEILKNQKFLIINSLLSVLFSYMFYSVENNPELYKRAHIYLIMYLTCASILMAELLLFSFDYNVLYSYIIMYILFGLDMLLFKANRKHILLLSYVIISICACTLALYLNKMTLFYGLLFNSIYSLIALTWQSMDTEQLMDETNEKTKPSYFSLKYFLDFEGIFSKIFL
jgi:hypothetical protein